MDKLSKQIKNFYDPETDVFKIYIWRNAIIDCYDLDLIIGKYTMLCGGPLWTYDGQDKLYAADKPKPSRESPIECASAHAYRGETIRVIGFGWNGKNWTSIMKSRANVNGNQPSSLFTILKYFYVYNILYNLFIFCIYYSTNIC